MAWSNVGATPGSISAGKYISDQWRSTVAILYSTDGPNWYAGGGVNAVLNPLVNAPLITPPSGELTYSGGGGGSTRPSTGILYPRGDC
jgi:hypothetical protein